MTKRMLIDATHSEETRVAVIEDGRLEEFDYESAFRKPLKGNIYLAKVTRVEPSLQAAFVNFGGNRHGFLPFSEIHPDYFRIPIADREALMAEQEEALRQAEAAEEAQAAEDERLAAEEAAAASEVQAPQDQDSFVEIEDDKGAIEEIGGNESSKDSSEEEGEISAEAGSKPKKDTPKKRPSRARRKPETQALAMETDVKVSEDLGDENVEDTDEINGNVRGPEDKEYSEDEDDDQDETDANGNYVPRHSDDADGNADQSDDGQDGNRGRSRRGGRFRRGGRRGGRNGRGGGDGPRPEKFGGEDIDYEQRFRFNLRRKYKIQEVIKRGQIMLVQVNKEERGNKGAAVGSYLSLPGRYCVLMPNSPRAGGVSRKIANHQDRARMREIMKDLEVPKGMSVILRTAGVSRTKVEIKRDLDYLMRLWDNIRELTLESTAPALVYEEADLIKRAVRDLYTRDIDEIHVSGAEGFNTAKNFMKMLMPSHIKKVVEYKESTPLFNHYRIEKQIAEIGESQVTLPAGGYLVINQTEALVAIDVNSGKATKERHIEETALRTNLEAADEVARQLRLRDLGGLVVIDFIDMEDRRNNAKVERRMREALSTDRARIQMGRISSFGLMELSRQRLSPSLTESQFELCQHCHGVGRVRTADAASILVLRAIEEEGLRGRASQVIAHVPGSVAMYILNNKRQHLSEIEARHNIGVILRVDEGLGVSGYRVEVSRPVMKDGAEGAEGEFSSDEDDGEEKTSYDRPPRHSHEHRSSSPEHRSEQDEAERGERRRRGRRGGRKRGGRGRGEREGSDGPASASFSDSEPSSGSEDEFENEEFNAQAVPQDSYHEEVHDERDDEVSEIRGPQNYNPEPSAQMSSPSAARISNDDKPRVPPPPRDYEKVNEPPEKPKKGWWNKLIE